MLQNLFSTGAPKGKSKSQLRELQRERHFEALMMQSWTDMRARAKDAPR